jgi:hypothetical protein
LTFAQPPLGCFDGRCASRWRSLQAESGTRVRRINAARASSCQLVYVEAEDTASDGESTCLQCDGPLPGRDGSFIRKYFLVDRKCRRRSKVTPSSHQPVKYALAQS